MMLRKPLLAAFLLLPVFAHAGDAPGSLRAHAGPAPQPEQTKPPGPCERSPQAIRLGNLVDTDRINCETVLWGSKVAKATAEAVGAQSALALKDSDMQRMREDATALAQWWGAYVKGLEHK
jgi:hypothetical protein